MPVFFSSMDYGWYKAILAQKARKHCLQIWAYCLMPNHVHLVVVPDDPGGLARPLGQAHQMYARDTNRRQGWTGHLWQERFRSFPMDERHLFAATRYVLLNPVRAGLVKKPEDWHYSSARAHLDGEPDVLIEREPLDERIEDWNRFLVEPAHEEVEAIREHSRTGRPLGSADFVERLEEVLQRSVRPKRRGRSSKRDR